MQNSFENAPDESGPMDADLHELFLCELAELYDAENQLAEALPRMSEAAMSDELRQAIEAHLQETLEHITRLEAVAETLEETLKEKSCRVMQALVTDALEMLETQRGKSSSDAAIIAAVQKMEHFEVSFYGTLIAWADEMGHSEAVGLLEDTFVEEKAADEKLALVGENVADQV